MFSNYPLSVTTLIIIHVLASLLAIIIGIVAMWARKGGKRHIQTGKIFFWSMVTVCLTGSMLLFYDFNIFLGVITILSFYTSLTGYRAPSRRKTTFAGWIDWTAAITAMVSGILLSGVGIGLFTGLLTSRIPT